MKAKNFRAVAIILAAALSACSPPGEIDSSIKVRTADPVAQHKPALVGTPSSPGYLDCAAAKAEVRPRQVSLSCIEDLRVTEITWQSWQADAASGSGKLEGSTVQVALYRPVLSPSGETLYSAVAVDGVEVYR